MVLHDLNHASRFSHHIIAMKNGELMKEGTPEEVITCHTLLEVFDINATLAACPFSHNPICLSYHLNKEFTG